MILNDILKAILMILFAAFSFGGVSARNKIRSERLLIMAVVCLIALCVLVIFE